MFEKNSNYTICINAGLHRIVASLTGMVAPSAIIIVQSTRGDCREIVYVLDSLSEPYCNKDRWDKQT